MAKTARTGRKDGVSRRRRYAAGESSREHILKVAEKVLRRDGFHAFTTRRVAQECGISVGNLTYYFPAKAALVEAVMEAVFRRYERHLEESLAEGDFGTPGRVMDFVRWLLRDAVADDTRDLFLELWVMAKHHGFGAKAITRIYDNGARAIAKKLAADYPNRTEQELIAIGYFLLTLSEGSTALFGRKGRRAVSHEEVVGLAVDAVQGLLDRA